MLSIKKHHVYDATTSKFDVSNYEIILLLPPQLSAKVEDLLSEQVHNLNGTALPGDKELRIATETRAVKSLAFDLIEAVAS